PLLILEEFVDDQDLVGQMLADDHFRELVHHPLDRRGDGTPAILPWNHAWPHLPLRIKRQVYVWLLKIGPKMLENILLGIPANLRIEEEELLGVGGDLEVMVDVSGIAVVPVEFVWSRHTIGDRVHQIDRAYGWMFWISFIVLICNLIHRGGELGVVVGRQRRADGGPIV